MICPGHPCVCGGPDFYRECGMCGGDRVVYIQSERPLFTHSCTVCGSLHRWLRENTNSGAVTLHSFNAVKQASDRAVW